MSTRGGSRSGGGRRRLHDGGNGWTERGGYMNAKIQKLEGQFENKQASHLRSKGSTSHIFAGVSIYVNGHTNPSAAELRTIMSENGGKYREYNMLSHVTHVIASNLAESKARAITTQKVVRPEWITDSLKNGKLLSHERYLLYTSRSHNQPGLDKFTKTKFGTSTSSTSLSDERELSGKDTVKMTTQTNCDVDTERTDASHRRTMERDTNDSTGTASTTTPTTSRSSVVTPTVSKPSPPSGPTFRSPAAAGSAEFLSEFYSHSRLHHISTWGAECKTYVSKLHAQENPAFDGRERLRKLVEETVGDRGEDREDETGGPGGRPQKVIMHIDMDCFFVSVGLRNRPSLKDKPVAVTHSRGKGVTKERDGADHKYEMSQWKKKGLRLRKGPGKGKMMAITSAKVNEYTGDDEDDEDDEDEGIGEGEDCEKPESNVDIDHQVAESFHSMAEIASCNYEARKAGVKNGMFMGMARKLCPDLVTIPYDFDGYKDVSQTLYDTVASFTHDIEAVSCDEMLVDCTDLLADTGATPLQFSSLVRQEILNKTGCNASAGLGPSILLARMATRVAKPNGQYFLKPSEAVDFIKDKPVDDLPGVGRVLQKKLAALGISTCGQLQKLTLTKLQEEFGPKTGQALHRFSRGQDDRVVKLSGHERKSVSAEINYGIRFLRESDVEHFMVELSGEVHTRLSKLGVKGKTITLKLKVRAADAPKETAKFLGHGICDNITKSTTIPLATDDPKIITKEIMGILRPLNIPPSEFRGVGIQLSRLEPATVGGKSSAALAGHQSILNFTTKQDTKKGATDGDNVAEPMQDKVSTVIGMREGQSVGNGTDCGETDSPHTHRPVPEQITTSDPPLPSLPTLLTPKTSSSRLLPNHAVTGGVTSLMNDLDLPSPSQIDPDVLRELPEDIRAQIEGAIEAKRGPASSTRRSLSRRNGRAIAGGSGLDTVIPRSPPGDSGAGTSSETTSRFADTQQDQPIVALPSYSQLDPSCLEALPPEVRAELVEAYEQQNRQTKPTTLSVKQPVHPLMQGKGRGSPVKSVKNSPGKGAKKSPVFKKPRGGKAGNRTRKKLAFTTTSTTSAVSTADVGVTEEVDPTPGTSTSPQKPPRDEPMVAVQQDVHLCGGVTLDEVKTLVREWTMSCEEPERDDINQLVDYLNDLVKDYNLERIHLVLKYFRRCLAQRQRLSLHWEAAYEEVLNSTQSVVQTVYGSRLRM